MKEVTSEYNIKIIVNLYENDLEYDSGGFMF